MLRGHGDTARALGLHGTEGRSATVNLSHDEDTRASLLPIGVVVEILRRDYPDVSHSSLRFLEREHLVRVERTAGGHRLYSRDTVERIRLIKHWQSRRWSLADIRVRLDQLDTLPPPSQLADAFLHLALKGELAGASRLILDAADAGLPIERIFGDILDPALQKLGAFWSEGVVQVAQEKELSEIARELITDLTLRHAGHPSGPSLVAASVEGERHELGLRMVCGLLRIHRYRVHFLGADVATRFLVESVLLHHPIAVLLSASQEAQLPAMQEAIGQVLACAREDAPLLVLAGGALAHRQAEAIRSSGAVPLHGPHLSALMTTLLRLLAQA